MFKRRANYGKLQTNLKISIERFRQCVKKRSENNQKARREIADYLAANKVDRAKVRVEHVIREDYTVEAFEILEMYCDLLLARLALIKEQK